MITLRYRSKGALHNILNLIRSGKKTLVYLAQEKAFHKLKNEEDVQMLLARCDPGLIGRAVGKLDLTATSRQDRLPLPTS